MEEYIIKPEDYAVMIVDDDQIIRVMTEELLRDVGYQVIGFECPVAAIDFYQEHFREIDFVILDMMMPKLNGAEVFLKLLAINPFVRAIVLSGYEGVEAKFKHLLDEGLLGFLRKPVDIGQLDKSIRDLLSEAFTINPSAGLATLMNKEQIYIKLLQTYYNENKNLDLRILELIKNNDLEGVANIIHKIKGISLNLGSKQTYNLSSRLNRQFVDNDYQIDDIVYFVKHHYFLIKDIERLLRKINV